MTIKPLPAEGNIELNIDFGITDLNNGEKRIVAKETGVPIQGLIHAVQQADGNFLTIDEFDSTDLDYAFGRIALRRTYGNEADTPENADRVFPIFPKPDPTPAS